MTGELASESFERFIGRLHAAIDTYNESVHEAVVEVLSRHRMPLVFAKSVAAEVIAELSGDAA